MEYYIVEKEWSANDTERSSRYISPTEKNKVQNSVYDMLPFLGKEEKKIRIYIYLYIHKEILEKMHTVLIEGITFGNLGLSQWEAGAGKF